MDELSANISAVLSTLLLLAPVATACAIVIFILATIYYHFLRASYLRTTITLSMFATFGATIGLFMGASASPIITSILPPVITLVSGYLAFTTTKDMPAKVRILMPGALLALLISLLFSAFYMKFWYVPHERPNHSVNATRYGRRRKPSVCHTSYPHTLG